MRNLIRDLDKFNDLLAEARQARQLLPRTAVDAGRAAALRATGRDAAAATPTAQPVGKILPRAIAETPAAQEAFKELQRLKDSLQGGMKKDE